MDKYFNIAILEAQKGIKKNEGGPFGAIIVNKEGKIIGKGHNKVLKEKDPTSHAEINAIKDACHKIKSSNLSDCTIYTTTEPCPMCLSAIIWANIKEVYYATDRNDAKSIGFRDDDIYEYLKGNNSLLHKEQIKQEECEKLIFDYDGKIY